VSGRRTFTCSNPSCKKSFDTPLKTLDLNQDSPRPFDACPYCLNKIPDAKLEKNKLEKTVEPSISIEMPIQDKEKGLTCHYYLGYLSEREQKEQIPDECIVCKDILECMLRKMRQQA
jgi:hypothetical protein